VTDELTRRVREGMPVLEFVARRISKRMGFRFELDDVMALGHPALLEVARTYDPSRAKFTTYAALKIKWAILDGLKREAARGPLAAARAAALAASTRFGEASDAIEARRDAEEPATEDVYQERLRALLEGHAAALAIGLVTAAPEDVDELEDGALSPEESAARAELRRTIEGAVRGLPERERALIERHYFGGEPFDVIARDLGISKSWASRLHAQAIQALAGALHDADS
jgi:RNA polymerase sigma factor for flagellar operon FliA